MPLRTVALNMSGIACAYSGCRQNGHMKGQSVKFSAAGTTDARGVYPCSIFCAHAPKCEALEMFSAKF